MKELNSFAASQSAPVHKDVINYMLDGTREEVNKTINASNKIICPECKAENDKDALFCSNCGHKLKIVCPKCNSENDADAKFCKNCLSSGCCATEAEKSAIYDPITGVGCGTMEGSTNSSIVFKEAS